MNFLLIRRHYRAYQNIEIDLCLFKNAVSHPERSEGSCVCIEVSMNMEQRFFALLRMTAAFSYVATNRYTRLSQPVILSLVEDTTFGVLYSQPCYRNCHL